DGVADHEAGNVGEEEQWHVERVAHLDETGGLVGGVDEEHAALLHRLIRDDADGLTVEPGEADEQLARPQLVDLEEGTLIDQPAYEPAHVERLAFAFGDESSDVDGFGVLGLRRRRALG